MKPAPWTKPQKHVVHQYVRYARMTDVEYRFMLRQWTFLGRLEAGALSSRDARLDQADFDLFMPALEAELWRRVDADVVPPPQKVTRGYWATRCGVAGHMTSRQAWHIQRMWQDLRTKLSLPPDYLDRITAKATSRRCTDWRRADASEAWRIIEALLARLRQAV